MVVDTKRSMAVWIRLALFVMLLGAAVVLAFTVERPSVADLREHVSAAGAAAPVLFVALYAVATLMPLPKNAFSAAGGILFGLGWGLTLVYLGAMIGAVVGFELGRLLGRAAVERFTGARVARLDELLAERGFVAVVALRLVPVLPFTAINYSAGLTGIRRRDYLAGTGVGIIPGTVSYVVLGSYAGDPTGWPFLVSLGALLLLSVGGLAAGRHRHVHRHRPQADRRSDDT